MKKRDSHRIHSCFVQPNNKQQTTRKPREKSINMNDSTDLQYPNLTTCRVVLCATPGMDKPPVRLPRECLQAAESFRLPPIYDFEVGTFVLGGVGPRQDEWFHIILSHFSDSSSMLLLLLLLLVCTENRVLEAHDKYTNTTENDVNKIRKSVLAKMKSVTRAEEEVCISLLEDNQYDLKASIEAFLTSS